MLFLLDTSAFSDLMRESPEAEAHLAALSESDRVAVCAVVRGEILYGLERLSRGKRRDKLSAKAGLLFSVIPCVAVPVSAADCYATMKLARQRQGLTLDENDLWIAATAMALSARLVSRDTDFADIAGLQVDNWSAS